MHGRQATCDEESEEMDQKYCVYMYRFVEKKELTKKLYFSPVWYYHDHPDIPVTGTAITLQKILPVHTEFNKRHLD